MTKKTEAVSKTRLLNYTISVTIVILLLIASRFYSYLLFHSIAEIFAVLVAGSVFLLAWNARHIMKNNYFLFIGTAFLSVAVIDFVHTLAYKGMNIFTGFDANLPTQLWIAGRYLLFISMLIAPFMVNIKRLNDKLLLAAYSGATVILLLSVFIWQNFPAAYIEGTGLTDFKKASEYIISLAFLVSIFLHKRYAKALDKHVLLLIQASLFLNIAADLAFTLYFNVYDIFNMAGHIIKIFAYYLIYKAVIEIGLINPYRLLFIELETLNKRKDEFIGMASHEIKTPITSIKGFSYLLTKLKDDVRRNDFLHKIDTQADKITNLINELLDVSKIEAGKMAFRQTNFDLYKSVKKIVEDLGKLPNNHIIEIKGRAGAIVKADEDRITQVLINLINNAIKYSPEGSKITVRVTRNGNYVSTVIQDSGIGISPRNQTRIFEKYYRSNNRKRDGLGLGLYISKEIITQHRGKIWVESKLGKGSTFIFTLPAQSDQI